MTLELAQLIACGLAPTQARMFLAPLAEAFAHFEINTPARVAAFIAQAAHESVNFTQLEENLWYTTPARIRAVFPSSIPDLATAARYLRNPRALANRVYANRLGNGDESSGDGFRYRGRGLFQITGRAEYMAAGEALRQPYKEVPGLVAVPPGAALTAAWYWATCHLNRLADNSDIDAITRRINGPAMLGADERRSRFDDALRALA